MLSAPDFIDSPYIHITLGKWTIDEDAPEELKKEFYTWMKQYEDAEKDGVLL